MVERECLAQVWLADWKPTGVHGGPPRLRRLVAISPDPSVSGEVCLVRVSFQRKVGIGQTPSHRRAREIAVEDKGGERGICCCAARRNKGSAASACFPSGTDSAKGSPRAEVERVGQRDGDVNSSTPSAVPLTKQQRHLYHAIYLLPCDVI